jgi:hypothetical protein
MSIRGQAAALRRSTLRSQLINRFQLAKFSPTISKSLILND